MEAEEARTTRVVRDPGPSEGAPRSGLLLAVLSSAGTLVALQQTLVVPLLPDLPRLLGTSVENASWLITATLLSGAVATPTLSRLADMYGKRRMLAVALGCMIIGSLVGALGTSVTVLVLARMLQGVGMAVTPIGIAIMRDTMPTERVPLGVAVMSATMAIGAGAGMPLAGFIAAYFDWRAIFWVTGLLGILLLGMVWWVVEESEVVAGGRFDLVGTVVLTAALTALFLALSKGSHWGWTSAPTLGLAALGLFLALVWVPMELRIPDALIDIRTAARPPVLLVNIAAVLCGFAMYSNMLVSIQLLYAPEETGYGLRLDLFQAGLWMAPSALTFGAMAPVAAWVTRRFGPLSTLVLGSLGMSLAYVLRSYVSAELWQVVVGSVIVGAGTSLTYAAMPILIMRAVPVTETAQANGLNTLLRSVGTSSSSAAMAAIASVGSIQVGAGVYPSFAALQYVFWLSALTALIAAGVVLPLRQRAASRPHEVGHS